MHTAMDTNLKCRRIPKFDFRHFSVNMSDLWCFLPVSTSEQHLCPQAALAFYCFLSENVEKLDRSLGEGPVSLRWSVEAMDLLNKLQIELLELIKKWKLPVAPYGAEEDWLDQYMDETLTLLDFCNSLKSAISGMDRYRMVVDLTLQKLVKGSPSFRINWFEEIELGRAATVATSVKVVGREIGILNKNRKKTDKTMASVMLAARCTMIVVSTLLVSVIVSPVPIDIRSEELTSEFPQLKPFMLMLTTLVARFHERVLKPRNDCSRLVLAEYEMVDSTVEDLKALVAEGDRERILESAELLRTSSDELREGIERFDAVVDEVFGLVLKGRIEMLDAFKAGTLSWN